MKAVEGFVQRVVAFNIVLAGIGALLVSLWTFALFLPFTLLVPSLGIFFTAVVMMIGLLIHFVALSTGNHIISWGSATYLSMIVLLSIASLDTSNGTALALFGGISVLVYNETIRLSYAHRRQAMVDKRIYFSSAGTLLVATFLGVVGLQFAQLGVKIQPNTFDGDNLPPTNWRTPVSVGVIVLALLGTLIFPTFGRNRQKLRRLRPGLRIDFDELKKSTKKPSE